MGYRLDAFTDGQKENVGILLMTLNRALATVTSTWESSTGSIAP